ncbi:MAG: TetR/AcrR family transcriptional regulator [Lachnospiraceae bacterium]|nr:TetR/AcrR family transcriptional regulator [Lachnospiraceae bacterium]MDY4969794.1 TetR/AcrR family transcriptional regulator [Lachnospiraceae bacterium]
MDLRIQKTRKSIVNAFLELRSRKPIEKITVTELAELAMINKATFYKHYKDIYDLSESLENEMIASILRSIREPGKILSDPYELTMDIFHALTSQSQVLATLFSGSRRSYLIQQLDVQIKEMIFREYPEYKEDLEKNAQLTFIIQGGFYAFLDMQKMRVNTEQSIDILSRISKNIMENGSW